MWLVPWWVCLAMRVYLLMLGRICRAADVEIIHRIEVVGIACCEDRPDQLMVASRCVVGVEGGSLCGQLNAVTGM